MVPFESRDFFHTPCIRRPRCVGSRRNIAMPFGVEKLEWLSYQTVKKTLRVYNRVDTIPACVRQTDKQTDRRTDADTSCHGIVRAMHSRRAFKACLCA